MVLRFDTMIKNNFKKISVKSLVFALILGLVQYCLALVLVFYGSVINPTLIYKIFSTIGVVLLLPFSLLIFIPALGPLNLDIVYGLLSLCFWVIIYYFILKKWCFKVQ